MTGRYVFPPRRLPGRRKLCPGPDPEYTESLMPSLETAPQRQPPASAPPAPESSPTQPALTLAEHLEEIRRRLGISFLAVLAGIGASVTQMERLLRWLLEPARPHVLRLAFFSPAEPLMAYFKVATLAGLVLAMPVLLAQVWGFVRAGLTNPERRWGLAFIWSGSALFLCGAAFAYYGLLPLSLKFLLGLAGQTLEPVISLQAYLSFVTTLTFWCGLLFELPAVLFLLAKIGIVTPEWLRQQRPYAILVLVIIAAVVTPTTDVASLTLLTVPLIVLYEVSIILTRLAMRGARRVARQAIAPR